MLPELTAEELAGALDAVAGDVLASAGCQEPPVDALALGQALGCQVAWDDAQSGRARLVCSRRSADVAGLILLRHDPRIERLQWAAAHELGEVFAAQVFDRLGVDPREAPAGARERVANQLAGRLLLPTDWFAAAGRECDWDLLELKGRFGTASHELIARRMLDFAPPIVVTIFDHGRLTMRQGNAVRRPPALSPEESACWRRVHETGQSQRRETPELIVRGWPVHEPDWKREILRTEGTYEE